MLVVSHNLGAQAVSDGIMRIFWSTRPNRFEIGLVFVLAVALTVLAFMIGRAAWMATPFVADFSHFAEPAAAKVQGKAEYLFMPLMFALLGLFGFVAFAIPWRGQSSLRAEGTTRGQLYANLLVFVMICFISALQATRATDAAYQHHVQTATATHPTPDMVPVSR